ncbi:MAG: 5'/3'-nucleotidase SurE, partial [Pseudomonadota bacterium]
MRILITNDDGISAPGLQVLEEIAATLSDDLWVVAPAFEQSGVGHCISYARPFMIQQIGDRRVAVEGSPADCVLTGLHEVLPGAPDLILSGVNRGNNSAENALYSGTLGAAIEGSLQGVPAIALSQFYGPRNAGANHPFEASAEHGAEVIRRILDANPKDQDGYQLFYNVNFPPMPAADVLGIRAAAQGRRPSARFGSETQKSPNGRD